MGTKWGNCDFKQLQRLRDNLGQLQRMDLDTFCRDVSRELAARLLALVIPRTPVGNYKVEVQVTAKRDSKRHKKGDIYTKYINPTGKVGGTLRRGWTARTEQEAVSRSGENNAMAYALALPIVKVGGEYRVEVINPVRYASYVEFGHRQEPGRYVPAIGKSLKKGWVEGKHFLTVSEDELRNFAPALIEQKLEKCLREAFRV